MIGLEAVQAAMGPRVFADYFFAALIGAVTWGAGRMVRSRTRLAAELHEATARLAEAGEDEQRLAAVDERRRIAREMHDVVAHSISVMVVQAGGARRILTRDAGRAVEAATRIERTGREALGEMRHLLGMLSDGADRAALAPQPTLGEIGELVARARAAGLPAVLDVRGERQPLSAGLDLAAYRIVQEGLTNAMKHAPGAVTTVTVSWAPHDLALEIRNAANGGVTSSGGHGLTGMAERVRLYGGELQAGPADGGWRVSARLPLTDNKELVAMSVRLLIADDQALVRAGFRMILDAEDDLDVIGEATDGLDAVEQAKRLKPDVVLMDIRMPELDGIEATRRLLAQAGDHPVRVLMLTTFDLNEYVYEALRAGASGFLLKDVPPEQLAAGIRVVAQGEALLAPSITRRLIKEFAAASPTRPTPPKGLDELTARELEVFRCVARGLSNAEIAAELIVSETTVKTHVARMLMKLGLRDRVQAVVLAYESGIAVPGKG